MKLLRSFVSLFIILAGWWFITSTARAQGVIIPMPCRRCPPPCFECPPLRPIPPDFRLPASLGSRITVRLVRSSSDTARCQMPTAGCVLADRLSFLGWDGS